MTDETYEGWKNRETWALNLWLSNDQGLYEMTRERVSGAVRSIDQQNYWTPNTPRITAGEAVKEFWEELTDPSEELVSCESALVMVRDVGSDYRVDWDAIGAHWLQDVTENPVEEES